MIESKWGFPVHLKGRYRIERELGEGGMATVYLADDRKHERKIALKVLKPELAAVVGGERFLAEIKTTAKLQHPHILPLHDSGDADGFVFYVMPYVEGESLRDKLDRETATRRAGLGRHHAEGCRCTPGRRWAHHGDGPESRHSSLHGSRTGDGGSRRSARLSKVRRREDDARLVQNVPRT